MPLSNEAQRAVDQLLREGKPVEAGWMGYRLTCVPQNAGSVQVGATRDAFFAGAQYLLLKIMNGLTPGSDPQEEDLLRLQQIELELKTFYEEVLTRATSRSSRG